MTVDFITVLGGGSWGTSLAHLLASAGHAVSLVLRDSGLAAQINEQHCNPVYLPGLRLHTGIRAYAGSRGTSLAAAPDVKAVLEQTKLLVLSVPCQVIRGVLRELAPLLPSDCILVNTAKGIEVSARVTGEQIMREEWPALAARYAILSGPSFAREVAENKPTAVVLGCRDERLGSHLREIFSTPWFRTYSSTDVTGVELGGAIKNSIAIAAGLSDGLSCGLNARAALVTRGLAETSRLGAALGARATTFMGLSGLGDLMLTCSGDLSRNRQVGLRLGAGESLEAITSSLHMVAEGIRTTEALHVLATEKGVDMPVTKAVYAVLYEKLPPLEAVQSLMTRQLREE